MKLRQLAERPVAQRALISESIGLGHTLATQETIWVLSRLLKSKTRQCDCDCSGSHSRSHRGRSRPWGGGTRTPPGRRSAGAWEGDRTEQRQHHSEFMCCYCVRVAELPRWKAGYRPSSLCRLGTGGR